MLHMHKTGPETSTCHFPHENCDLFKKKKTWRENLHTCTQILIVTFTHIHLRHFISFHFISHQTSSNHKQPNLQCFWFPKCDRHSRLYSRCYQGSDRKLCFFFFLWSRRCFPEIPMSLKQTRQFTVSGTKNTKQDHIVVPWRIFKVKGQWSAPHAHKHTDAHANTHSLPHRKAMMQKSFFWIVCLT